MDVASVFEKWSQCKDAASLHSIWRPPDGSSSGCKKTTCPVEVNGKMGFWHNVCKQIPAEFMGSVACSGSHWIRFWNSTVCFKMEDFQCCELSLSCSSANNCQSQFTNQWEFGFTVWPASPLLQSRQGRKRLSQGFKTGLQKPMVII